MSTTYFLFREILLSINYSKVSVCKRCTKMFVFKSFIQLCKYMRKRLVTSDINTNNIKGFFFLLLGTFSFK